MSLKTKIRGYTSWVNLRLKPYDKLMNNVLMDLMTGTNLKHLVESLIGKSPSNVDSFDQLTQQQKITRIEWLVNELKKFKVLQDDVFVDYRLFAMKSADHVFDLLWRLLSHDAWLMWERTEFLQQTDDILLEHVFRWVPEAPPEAKRTVRKTQNLLSGFGASSFKIEYEEDDQDSNNYERFPEADFMKKFKKIKRNKFPPPQDCVLELVNTQLRQTNEGLKLHCDSLDDLSDSRVLCALFNSFVPNTFTSEILLNDRWTLNCVLKTAEEMFYSNTPFDSEDLVEGDDKSLTAYFLAFFMLAYKYKQCKAVAAKSVSSFIYFKIYKPSLLFLLKKKQTTLKRIIREFRNELSTDNSLTGEISPKLYAKERGKYAVHLR